MDINLDEEIERMNEEIIELREDNQRLHNMCVIMEQISDILTPIVNECKCHTIMNSKIKTKLNILTHKYKQLKDSENITNCVFNYNHNNSNNHKQKLIEKLKNCSKLTPKKLIINSNCSETNSDHNYEIECNLIECKDDISVELQDNNDRSLVFDDNEQQELKLEVIDLPQVDKEVEVIANSNHNHCNNNNNIVITSSVKRKSTRIKRRPNNEKDYIIGKQKRVRDKHRIKCTWPGCELSFRDHYNLQVHMTRHTGEKSYICQWPGCVKCYATKAALDVHYNQHSDNRRFRCEWPSCDAAFIRKTQLTVHVSDKHTGNRKFKCDWPGCEYQSCYLNRLQAHKMRHTGEKPYHCNWPDCEWSFRLLHHLKTHMLKHTGEKPFDCEWHDCLKSFQSKQAMRIHIDKVHLKQMRISS